MQNPTSLPTKTSQAFWLCVVFGTLYFVQGIAEPTEGLIAQPIRSLQHDWGRTTEEIATFAMIIGLPWSVKPLFGLLIDFVPLWGFGKRGYLVLSALVTAVTCGLLFTIRGELDQSSWLLPLMVCATAAIATSDVAVDALMVQHGQPLGLTGRLQSVQWSCMYAATFIAGPLGGELSQRKLQAGGFAIAGLLAAASVVLILFWRPNPVNSLAPAGDEASNCDGQSEHVTADRDGAGEPGQTKYSLGFTLAFLMLWSFNPFSSSVQYSFMKDHLGFDDRFIGLNTSALAAGALLASIAYGVYCRRVPFHRLLQVSVIAGVAATLAYAGMTGRVTALAVSMISGATYMTGTLIQLDLAARACPPRYAGTVFSSLMAASNFSLLVSTYVGGWAFGRLAESWPPLRIFQFLVLCGAAASAACWFLIGRVVVSEASTDDACK